MLLGCLVTLVAVLARRERPREEREAYVTTVPPTGSAVRG